MNLKRLKEKICKVTGGHKWNYHFADINEIIRIRVCNKCNTVQYLTKNPYYLITKREYPKVWMTMISRTNFGAEKWIREENLESIS